jgi:hypothetical protein
MLSLECGSQVAYENGSKMTITKAKITLQVKQTKHDQLINGCVVDTAEDKDKVKVQVI